MHLLFSNACRDAHDKRCYKVLQIRALSPGCSSRLVVQLISMTTMKSVSGVPALFTVTTLLLSKFALATPASASEPIFSNSSLEKRTTYYTGEVSLQCATFKCQPFDCLTSVSQATWYYVNGGVNQAGACGQIHYDNEQVVALSADLYANGALCNKVC